MRHDNDAVRLLDESAADPALEHDALRQRQTLAIGVELQHELIRAFRPCVAARSATACAPIRACACLMKLVDHLELSAE